ncbi:hypothetical protein KVT40_002933 [Elsinoe batatas]|uniref:Ankyrin repeat-containing protein n=1 Tax=Elsinoe batatas TaxID=2601811 RepID=A0A8K0PJ17_9PEZI|nr:hypothetical protein KVT40_002933 [Elsinoe batatas]
MGEQGPRNGIIQFIGATRSIRECARQGVIPWPHLWASTKPFGTPFAPILLKWFMTIIVILALPFGDAFDFLVDLRSYPDSIFIFLMVVGIYALRRHRKKEVTGSARSCKKKAIEGMREGKRKQNADQVAIEDPCEAWYLPPWVASLAVSLTLVACARPHLIIRTWNIRPSNAPIFYHALTGNVSGVQAVLASGEGCVTDVTEEDGSSALSVRTSTMPNGPCDEYIQIALAFQQVSAVEFLLNQGADRHDKNFCFNSPAYDHAWDLILRRQLDRQTEDIFRTRFPEDDQFDCRSFTTIHKSIIGITHLELEQLLSASISSINQPDCKGYTPLMWAAARRNRGHVRLLLEFGADPRKSNHNGYTAVHEAIWPGNKAILGDLFEFGAKATDTCLRGGTGLHFVAFKWVGVGESLALIFFSSAVYRTYRTQMI